MSEVIILNKDKRHQFHHQNKKENFLAERFSFLRRRFDLTMGIKSQTGSVFRRKVSNRQSCVQPRRRGRFCRLCCPNPRVYSVSPGTCRMMARPSTASIPPWTSVFSLLIRFVYSPLGRSMSIREASPVRGKMPMYFSLPLEWVAISTSPGSA